MNHTCWCNGNDGTDGTDNIDYPVLLAGLGIPRHLMLGGLCRSMKGQGRVRESEEPRRGLQKVT